MKLYPFQIRGVELLESFGGRSLLADSMGLGKTIQVLQYLKQHPEALPAIVICPASVKYLWEHEAISKFGIRASVLEGQKSPVNGEAMIQPKLVILNYDILRFWVEWLRKNVRPKMIVLDESQYIMSPKTHRTKAAKTICRGIPYVIALSGTPLLNRPIELFSTLNILRPDIWKARWPFAQEFCDPKRTHWGWEFKGATHTTKLRSQLLEHCMIRRRKEDVLKDLPAKARCVVPLPLSDPDEYRRVDADFLTWLKQQDPTKVASALRAPTLVKLGYLKRTAARLKAPYVVEWANEFLKQTDEKLILFAVHRKMIEILVNQCKVKFVVVDGSVRGRKRKAAVDQFQNDGKTRLFIGNIQAAGVGITLTAASTVAFTELTWRPGDHVQAEDRCHRIGTEHPVFIYYLVARFTIEEDLCRLIQGKQKVLTAVLDGEGQGESLSVFDDLIKTLLTGGGS